MLRTRVLSPSKSRKRYPGTGPLGNTRRKGRKHKAKSSLLANTTTTSNTSLLTNLNTRKQLRKGMTFPSASQAKGVAVRGVLSGIWDLIRVRSDGAGGAAQTERSIPFTIKVAA